MKTNLTLPAGVILLCIVLSSWGFYGHKKINRLAVFTLPPSMVGFYKKNINYLTESSVNPDRRRYAVVDEAARHYIDLDHYGDSALYTMPRTWVKAVDVYTEDTLKAYGIVPWHVYRMYLRLRDAFMIQDPARILRVSSEIGHYIGDAHVPLHTTKNYNGQLTGQDGIHGFWESRLVELFSEDYDFTVGRAVYLKDPQAAIWEAVVASHLLKDSVLLEEKRLSERFGDRKWSFETRGRQTVKVYSRAYSKAYHKILRGMVERRMKSAVHMTGSFWYTAWVDAGQPDLSFLIDYQPDESEILARQQELEAWKKRLYQARPHDADAD